MRYPTWNALRGSFVVLMAAFGCNTPDLIGEVIALDILPQDVTVAVEEARSLQAIAIHEDGSAVDVTENVLWESSNPEVAVVEDGGLAQAAERGCCWITATWGNLTARTQLVVTSAQRPEVDIIEYKRPLPDPASSDYITVSEVVRPDTLSFNNAPRNVRSVVISGKTVVFEEGSSLNALYESYNGATDIQSFTVYAETVIVRDHLWLPQTAVHIAARILRFEDRGNGRSPAAIETTPHLLTTRPSGIGTNGAAGLNAGDITLVIDSFYETEPRLRFLLRGGAGQPAGLGRKGADGTSLTELGLIAYQHDWFYHIYYPNCGTQESPMYYPQCIWGWFYWVYDYGQLMTCPRGCGYCGGVVYDGISGTRDWPCDGGNAVRAGVPGTGGAGGHVATTFEIGSSVAFSGGSPGEKGRDTTGGAPGKPNPAIWVQAYSLPGNDHYGEILARRDSTKGSDASAPSGQPGPSGSVSLTDMPPPRWLHLSTLKAILQHAKDAYLNGNLDYVESTLSEYVQLIDDLGIATIAGPLELDQRDLRQVRHDMLGILQRVSSNLDYFGNPAGWTPMLSFEANFRAFLNEVDTAIPILYLCSWMQLVASNSQQTIQSIELAKENLESETQKLVDQHYSATEMLPTLLVDRDNLSNDLALAQQSLEMLEVRLLQRAQSIVDDRHKVPRWKKITRTLSQIAKVMPVGQPYLGAIGTGLDFIEGTDFSDPWEVYDEAQSAIDAFDAEAYEQDARDFSEMLQQVDPRRTDCLLDASCLQTHAEAAQDIYEDVVSRIDKVKDSLKETQAPRSEVEAELQRLKAQDPEFQTVIGEIQSLTERKAEFSRRMQSTVHKIEVLSSQILKNLVIFDGLMRDLGESYGCLDHRILTYVKEMEHRTKYRLLKYQYYLAKSSEYRLLRPYQGDLQLTNLFDRVKRLAAEPGSDARIPASDFDLLKNVYVEELMRIVAEVIDELNTFPPERSVPISFSLSENELRALNESGQVRINLVERGLFGDFQENLRIVNLRTKQIAVQPVGGDYGDHAILRLRIEHSGDSRLCARGKGYRFAHYRDAGVNPISWETVYDGIDGTLEHSEPSTAAESLIRFLLGLRGVQDPEWVMLYSRPGAWSDLIVLKEVTADNGIGMSVQSMRVELVYDYQTKSADKVAVHVETPDGLSPPVLVDPVDLNGRQDARGDFRRVYPAGQMVSFKAAPWYGRYQFDRWVGRSGDTLEPGVDATEVTVTLNDPFVLRPVYVERCADVGCANDSMRFVRTDVNVDGRSDLSDSITILGFLFLGQPQTLSCEKSADTDDNGSVDITDAICILDFLFMGGPSPTSPFPECGLDLTPDALSCQHFSCAD